MNYQLIAPFDNSADVLTQVLVHRGIDPYDIYGFLNPTEEVVYSPYDLKNAELAAKRILAAIVKKEPIYIQVDSDCDGYTSSATLINYLYSTFPASVKNLITYGLHSSKTHGIDVDGIPENTKLVIVPDASSNEVEIHQQLHDKGIDVVILDHHQFIEDESDPAIIVNCQVAPYPNKNLSGVGVVYKVCQIMDDKIGVSYADSYLDLVALGMIADMMDLRSLETKYLISKGLKNLSNMFFVTMFHKNSFIMKDTLNPFTVSFYIAPFVNAMTRVGSDEEKKLLFDSMLNYKAAQLVPSTKRGAKGTEELLVDQAVRVCGNVKKHQEDGKAQYLSAIRKQIEDEELLNEPIVIVQLTSEIDNNLSGLLANQLMAEYSKPTLILHEHIDEETGEVTWTGSARGYASEQVSDWRKYIEDSHLAVFAEGHPFAFGVAFTPENLDKFRNYVREAFGNTSFEPFYNVDFVFTQNMDIDTYISDLARNPDIWGQGVSEPMIVLQKIPVTKDKINLMGKGTLKININNHKTNCIKFGFGLEGYERLMANFPSDDGVIYITIVGTASLNEWNGTTTPQIKIKDYAIEGSSTWYF